MLRILSPRITSAFIVLGSSCLAGTMAAQLTPYRGFDRVTAPSVAGATNALGAESAWLSAAGTLGSIHTADFESLISGNTGAVFTIAPGVTMRAIGGLRADTLTVESSPSSFGPVDGFNTTAGGANHMRYYSGPGNFLQPAIQFDFAQPIAAFSLFMTGEGHSGLVGDHFSTRIMLNGSIFPAMYFGDQGNPYWPSSAQPNVKYGGFIDPTAFVTRVVLEPRFLSSDIPGRGSYSIDDVRWVTSPVPSPSAFGVFVLSGFLMARRSRH